MSKVLTISIAAYNIENYIERALDSLIDESVIDDLEIFVVDDGGTDRTLEIAQEYAEKYPNSIFCIHKENGGYGSTINTTIEMATGKYYKQLDGDDWFYNENLRDFIELLKNVSADVVLNANLNYYEESGIYTSFNYDYVHEGLFDIEEINLKTRLSIHTVTFLTSVLKRINRPLTEHCFYTDSEFISYPIPYIHTIYNCHKPIYVYRIGGREEQSSSLESIKKHYKEMEHVIKKIMPIYKDLDSHEECKWTLMLKLIQARSVELFRFYCILPFSLSSLNDMKSFKKWLKTIAPEILHAATQESKIVWLLINSHFLAYPIAYIWVKRHWRDSP